MADDGLTGAVVARASPAYWGYRWAWSSLDWLFPPRCGGCGQPGARWCGACQAAIRPLRPPLCTRCGQALTTAAECSACRQHPPHFTALRSWAVFVGPLRAAIHRLKFKGDLALGEILARPLIELAAAQGWPVDLVTPVPSSDARQAERGYNQAALLARPLALALGKPYRPQALRRQGSSRPQVGLNAAERRANVAGAFVAQPRLAAGRTVLVVDDVATTSATQDACAQALLQAGAAQVFAVTLARADWADLQLFPKS